MKTKFKIKSLILFLFFVLATSSVAVFFVISGAWFTSSDSQTIDTISLKFGSVRLGTNFRVMAVSDMVPTETIDYHGGANDITLANIDYAGNVDAYYRITFDVTNTDDTENAYSETFEKLLDFNTTSASLSANGQVRDDWSIYGKITPNSDIPRGTLRLSSETPNLFADKSFKIKVKIDLFQGVNLSGIEGVENLESNNASAKKLSYQNLFYYYDWGTVSEIEGFTYEANEVGADGIKTCTITGYEGSQVYFDSGYFKIPQVATINNQKYRVTKINSVSGASRITNLVMSPYVKEIGNNVFYNAKLETVTLSSNLKTIGSGCFSYNNHITKLNLPNSVESIGDSAFSPLTGLKSFKIPSSLNATSAYMCTSCSDLIMIVFGEDSHLQVINGGFIYGCANLKYVTIPKTVTSIASNMIGNNTGNGDLVLNVNPNNQTYFSENSCIIEISTYYLVCAASRSVIAIPEGVTRLKTYALFNNSNLTHLGFPSTCTYPGYYGINGCDNIEIIDITNASFTKDSSVIFSKKLNTINFNGTTAQYIAKNWTRTSLVGNNTQTITVHCTDGDLTYAVSAENPS